MVLVLRVSQCPARVGGLCQGASPNRGRWREAGKEEEPVQRWVMGTQPQQWLLVAGFHGKLEQLCEIQDRNVCPRKEKEKPLPTGFQQPRAKVSLQRLLPPQPSGLYMHEYQAGSWGACLCVGWGASDGERQTPRWSKVLRLQTAWSWSEATQNWSQQQEVE